MKRNLCLLALLCLFLRLPAQEKQPDNTNDTGLSIGDQVPELALNNMLNPPSGITHLSDYQGQWLILDFWATWCAPCITALPKLDSLQEVFKEKVQFLPVTYQSKEEVQKLLGRLEKSKGYKNSLPMVCADEALHKLFPHRELPYYVWINPEGEVVATTGGEALTAANIEALLAKKSPVLQNKVYVENPFNEEELLLAENREMPEKPVLYQSALLPYIEGLSIGYRIFPMDPVRGKRILATNSRLLSLYQLAYSSSDLYLTKNRLVLEVEDTTFFSAGVSGPAYTEWLQSGHAWCYELILPPGEAERAGEIMQEDLARFFPQFSAMVEERKRPVLALVQLDKKALKKLASKGGAYSANLSMFGGEIRNGLLADLIARLNAYFLQKLPTPVIDETGYTGRVDLKLEANMSNVESIREALRDYGLDLVAVERPIKVLVIQDRHIRDQEIQGKASGQKPNQKDL